MSNDDKVVEVDYTALNHIKWRSRTDRKFGTLLWILSAMPAPFSVIQKRARRAGTKVLSPDLLNTYLGLMVKWWKIVKKYHSLYMFNPDCLDFLDEKKITIPEHYPKPIVALMFYMPVEIERKTFVKKEPVYSTYAKLLGWDKRE